MHTRGCGPYLDADEREAGGNVPPVDRERPLLQPGVGHQERSAENREGGPQLGQHVPAAAGCRVQRAAFGGDLRWSVSGSGGKGCGLSIRAGA